LYAPECVRGAVGAHGSRVQHACARRLKRAPYSRGNYEFGATAEISQSA
jgi:hypothetical protein